MSGSRLAVPLGRMFAAAQRSLDSLAVDAKRYRYFVNNNILLSINRLLCCCCFVFVFVVLVDRRHTLMARSHDTTSAALK
jgi:hypothetical protein